MSSHDVSSRSTRDACSYGTLRAMRRIISRALSIIAGSHVFRVVRTTIVPSIRSRSATSSCSLNNFCTSGHTSRIYASRYFGKSDAKEDSQTRPYKSRTKTLPSDNEKQKNKKMRSNLFIIFSIECRNVPPFWIFWHCCLKLWPLAHSAC